MPLTYEPIATTTLSTAASSITFSSIPSTYTDLKMVLVASAASNANFAFQFNSDGGSNYSQTRFAGDGSSASTLSQVNQTYLQFSNYFYIGTTPTMHTVDIFSYAGGSTFKTVIFDEIADISGSGGICKKIGLWRSYSAINNIYLYAQGAVNFAAGTTATLYGIQNA